MDEGGVAAASSCCSSTSSSSSTGTSTVTNNSALSTSSFVARLLGTVDAGEVAALLVAFCSVTTAEDSHSSLLPCCLSLPLLWMLEDLVPEVASNLIYWAAWPYQCLVFKLIEKVIGIVS